MTRRPTEEQMARVSEFLYRRTGLVFGDTKHYYSERRITGRMHATGAADFESYYGRLAGDPVEVEALVNAFTINETYFYREKHQLETLSAAVLPIVATGKPPGGAIRIWSMPCSTGEEPYSIAIWLLENWPLVDAYNVEIVGSDIDTDVLAAARRGLYGARALSRLPQPLRERYFEPVGEDRWEILDDLKESVAFRPANLVNSVSLAGQAPFDVAFCRNLLIYFDERGRNVAMDNLYQALAPGGFVFLGHTESLAKVSERFIVTRFKGGVAYRKPVDAR
jgi:chemotaxis protein methyltransferase CheR